MDNIISFLSLSLSLSPRFRPTQSKAKKDTKLDFFGFEENEAGRGANQEGGSSDPVASGSSNYKIKYFGFDDMSGSDSDEDEGSHAKERKAKRAVATAAAATASLAAMEMRVDSPLSSSEELDSQTSSNTGQGQDFRRGQYYQTHLGIHRPASVQGILRPQARSITRTLRSLHRILTKC